MKRLYYFVKRRWMVCIPLFLILSFLVYNYVNKKQILYRAEATIAFIGEKGSFVPEAEANSIKNEDFLKAVSEKIAGPSAAALKKGLELRFKKESILSVAFVSSSPEVARDTANTICHSFLRERDSLIEDFNKEKKRRLKTVSSEITELQSAVNSSQKKIRELKTKNAQLDLKMSDLQKRFTELRLQKTELLKVFTERHPDVVNISDKVESLEAQLKQMPDNSVIYNKLTAEIDEKTTALSVKLNVYNELYSSYKDKGEPWYAKLAEEAPLPSKPIGRRKRWYFAWGLVFAFLISISSGVLLEAADKRIHTKAEAEERLKAPVIADVGKVAQITGEGKACGNRSIINYWSDPALLRTYQQIFAFLNVETFKGDIGKKTILVTSAEEKTGKSFIACNLAFAAAKSGKKVLLIDSDFRHPSIGKMFGFENDARGLSDILRGSSGHRDVVRNLTDLLLTGSLKLDKKGLSGLDNMKILLMGTKVENPLGLFGTKELSDLFKELTDAYGLLVIDSGSMMRYPDTLSIVPCADALLLVVNKGVTTYPLAGDAISKARKINGPLTGLVFSHV